MVDIKDNFFSQLLVSERTKVNYKVALNSSFLKHVLLEQFGTQSIFSVIDLQKLWEIYSYVNLHDTNVKNHRIYSAAIMRYIRFLNDGKKYGQRIDTQKIK